MCCTADRTSSYDDYIAELRQTFSEYRRTRFPGRDCLFEQRADGDAVVFQRKYIDHNVLIPPWCGPVERARIIETIPPLRRHRHFGSMQSSQALAQSIFGVIGVLGRPRLLSSTKSETGDLAFGSTTNQVKLKLEQGIQTLGELSQHTTSVDVWLDNSYRVAVECKLGEAAFGTCSRPKIRPTEERFETDHCDGTYTRQRGRAERCALTEVEVKYWKHTQALFGWFSEIDHRPCPLNNTYQVVRNILAACVDDDGRLNIDHGHALIIYDKRNPKMTQCGTGNCQWCEVYDALRYPSVLRRLSWQAFLAQWPNDPVLDWLKEELAAKYKLCAY